ncbi:hypothetical protein AB0I37_07245 [Micromonospora purpureochromogenes]|uniref:hypothetical protein n=1 Tax=Micromonospora purpureochromogenes TaxID=47872 RepID=UPI0033C7FE0D
MSDGQSPGNTHDRFAVAAADEPVRLPSWMAEAGSEQELTGAERRRLTWARHRGKLGAGFLVGVAVILVALTIVVGVAVVRLVGGEAPPAPAPTGNVDAAQDGGTDS